MLLLGLLLATMTRLATCRSQRFREADSLAGSLTYPLYLYHYVVLILVTSLFTN